MRGKGAASAGKEACKEKTKTSPVSEPKHVRMLTPCSMFVALCQIQLLNLTHKLRMKKQTAAVTSATSENKVLCSVVKQR